MSLPKPTSHPFASFPTRRELAHRIALLEACVMDLELSKPTRLGSKPNAPIEWPPHVPDMPSIKLRYDDSEDPPPTMTNPIQPTLWRTFLNWINPPPAYWSQVPSRFNSPAKIEREMSRLSAPPYRPTVKAPVRASAPPACSPQGCACKAKKGKRRAPR